MPTPTIDKQKCNLCGTCIDICPMQAFEKSDSEIKIAEDKCISCHACDVQCPKNAIEIKD